jgi:hypothetical protein
MSGALLDANYSACQSSSLQRLLTNANIFGLCVYGDGATIGKIPMMNILAASAGNPNCVIDIIDCSRHMSEGGKKDTYYICQQMLPKMRLLDPDKQHFDWISFDGAHNVQNAGSLTKQYFPHAQFQYRRSAINMIVMCCYLVSLQLIVDGCGSIEHITFSM